MPEEFQLARSIHLSINKERKKEEQRDEEEQRDVDEEEQEEKHQRHVVLDDVLAPHRKRMLDRFELLDFWGGAAVSIHSWVRSVTPSWPDQTIGGYLKDPVAFSTKLRENSTLLSQLATFSDTIVFDFLVDGTSSTHHFFARLWLTDRAPLVFWQRPRQKRPAELARSQREDHDDLG